MSEFPDPRDFLAQHIWLSLMLKQFARVLHEDGHNTEAIKGLTVAYLDKLVGTPQPPLPPDVAQMYERMSALFLTMIERERDE